MEYLYAKKSFERRSVEYRWQPVAEAISYRIAGYFQGGTFL